MNPLPAAIAPAAHLAHALGWTLLHFLWQGALVALILACILSLLSGRSAQHRYLAACCALALIVALPLVTFTRLVTAPQDATQTTIFLSTFVSANADPTLATPQQPLLQRLAANIDRAMPTLIIIWLAGVVLLLTRLGIGLIIARRMKSATTQQPPQDLLQAFNQLARRVGVARPIRLLNSALVQVPTVIGWLRPVVLVPLGCLAGLSPTQIEAVLAHELAHIRRHDYLISVLQSIVEALLFYHPAVWWVSQQIRREREHCCDDLAVAITGDPLTYARALSLLEEHRSTLPALTLGANGGILTMRIKRLLAPTQNPAISQLAALTLLGIVIAATATCITTAAHAQNNPGAQSPAVANLSVITEDRRSPNSNPDPADVSDNHHSFARQPAPGIQQLPTIYQNWLDQDVRWIITPEERAAFIQLTNDNERDTFIQQFWTRRDANAPATSSRAEHYSRIAYSNQHFAIAETPGWATDRGHIFIVNGPPNTVDSHPAAAPGGRPYETWRYAATPNGQATEFNFVDTCSCGNYQLQSQAATNSKAPTYSYNPPQPAPAAKPSTKPTLRPVSYKPPTTTRQSTTAPDPVHVAAGVIAGTKIFGVNPIYPPDAKANRIQGAVILEVIIGKDGTIQNINSVTGPDMLQESALEAVRQWIYKPYLLNGQPTEVQSTITVNYTLGPSDSDDQNDEASAITPKKIGGSVSAPKVIYQAIPGYSEQAKKDKTSGNVLVHLWVDEQGLPSHVHVLRGVGKGLDEKAIEAVKQYKFTPAMEDGKPVLVELNIEVNFQFF
jgi:TonB family protein